MKKVFFEDAQDISSADAGKDPPGNERIYSASTQFATLRLGRRLQCIKSIPTRRRTVRLLNCSDPL